MRDVTDEDEPATALAELVFGLSSLSGIPLDRLAEQSGTPPPDETRRFVHHPRR